jgi:S-DNA-T family DNA segregation ATPase FtsK/SpoIIIE
MPKTPPPPRWRLDAVALTLFAVGGLLAAAVGSHRPISGGPNLLGGYGDDAARLLLDPLGWAAVVFLAAWFVLAGRMVVTRSPGRLSMRLAGWLVLVGCAAVAADWLGPQLAAVSVAGRGGSIGAFVRFNAEDAIDSPWDTLVFAAVLMAGLVLAADRFVVVVLKGVRVALGVLWVGAVWVNDRVADASEWTAARLGAAGRSAACGVARLTRAVAKLGYPRPLPRVTPATPQAAAVPEVPITTVPDPELDTDEEELPDLHTDDIPITSHTDLQLDVSSDGPLLRAVPPPEDEGEPVEYEPPPLSLLNDPEPFPVEDHAQRLRDVAALLEKTFQDFGLNIKVVGIHTGPVITQYEVALETGLRLNKVTNLADDLALNLKVPSVRVVAPLPGRNTVGIEVPNEIRQVVRLKELITATVATPKVMKYKLPIFLGKDVEGRPLAYDLATMPHLLIAGRTGTGKSVCLNTIILSLLYTRRPDECRMILIDPKKVELSDYAPIPHLMTPVVKEDKKAEAILAWAVDKMEERYEWLHRARVRNIASYNDLDYEEILRRVNPDTEDERRNVPRKMPYIVIVIDEVGDLIMKMKKEIESNIILLAQKSRAAGIHLILATQKPTVDVVTGLIKSNLPARICFQVTNRSDSAVVLDEKGAERLLGQGDMLFLQLGQLTRAQGAYVDDREIERTVNAIATDTPNYDSELLNLKTKDQQAGEGGGLGGALRERDPVYEQAIEIVIREQRGSTSLLQRALGIGYGRASRLIDFMAEDGIVGAYNGSNARDVLVTTEEWDARKKSAG